MAQNVKPKQKRQWQDIAQEAQVYRDASIARVKPDVPQLSKSLPKNVVHIPRNALSEEEIRITETAPEDLLGMLASGELTATTVTTTFLRRAGLAQKLVCPISGRYIIPLLMPTLIHRQTVLRSSSLSER